jgi:hypothetical protein
MLKFVVLHAVHIVPEQGDEIGLCVTGEFDGWQQTLGRKPRLNMQVGKKSDAEPVEGRREVSDRDGHAFEDRVRRLIPGGAADSGSRKGATAEPVEKTPTG